MRFYWVFHGVFIDVHWCSIQNPSLRSWAFELIEVMQNAAQGGSPLDFLARFAGPIAWLVAGLLLLFGGLPFGGSSARWI